MSRMFDRLLANGVRMIPEIRPLQKYVPNEDDLTDFWADYVKRLRAAEPVVVVADNVAEYFWAGTDQEEWELTKDFPSLAPPWPKTFIEFHAPSRIVSREEGIHSVNTFQFGHRAVLIDSGTGDLPEPFPPMPDGARWGQMAFTFIEAPKGDISVVGAVGWYVAPDGTVLDPGPNRWQHMIFGTPAVEHYAQRLRAKGQSEAEWIRASRAAASPAIHNLPEDCGNTMAEILCEEIKTALIWPQVYVAALTYSFINCRNTVIKDVEPESPRLRKANLMRGKQPYVRYKILEIEPIKKILSVQGNAAATGLKHALHICRGHFKDYREHGLFGKYKDLYWWDMHVRGTATQGVVLKDYAMQPPQRAS
jgi:hypothetical protein